MNCSLLMANQDLADGGLVKLMKEMENRAPGIVEQGIDSLLLQALNNDLGTCFLHKQNLTLGY
jgi:hypothetical protein